MKNILIINRGLSAIKFILSIRDLYTQDQIKLIGIATSDDITSDYRYISQLDKILFSDNDIYMNIEKIISLCLQNNIYAVFPGWGYLSERSDFVKKLEENNILFMGPTSKTINLLGNKINSMQLAHINNVPLVKWSGSEPLTNLNSIVLSIKNIGVPCMIKEADGGGGKGIRVINSLDRDTIEKNYNQIINEMGKNNNTSKIFVMELMEDCHHIEVQLVGDGIKTIHLFGRDCTIQRRNQKLIEEGPITVAPPSIIKLCEDSAVKMAESVNYIGLGTAEFLYTSKNNKLTFLEINPRLQVEHIITELLLDINLPVILYKITCEKLRLEQIFTSNFSIKTNTYFDKPKKHVLSVRLNAENVEENFKPSTGTIRTLEIPDIVHSWSYISIHNGGKIINSVDAQFGHLFTVGTTRECAIKRMTQLIKQVIIDSDVSNSLLFLRKVINTDTFIDNKHTTNWINYSMFKSNKNIFLPESCIDTPIESIYWILGMINQGWYRWILYNNEYDKWIKNGHHIKKNNYSKISLAIQIDNCLIYCKGELYVHNNLDGWYTIELNIFYEEEHYSIKCELYPYSKSVLFLKLNNMLYRTQIHSPSEDYSVFNLNVGMNFYRFYKSKDPNIILSPITGRITNIFFENSYKKNQPIIEIESMKMIFSINSERESQINLRNILAGESICEGDPIGKYETQDLNYDQDIILKKKIYKKIFNKIPINLYSKCKPYIKSIKPNPKIKTEFEFVSFLERIGYKNIHLLYKNKPIIEKTWAKEKFKSILYEDIFNCKERECGIIGLILEGDFKFMVICHHKTYNKSGFSKQEQDAFNNASYYSRINHIPRIYLCNTFGAYLNYNTDLVNDLIFKNEDIFINKLNYEKWKNDITIDTNNIKYENLYKIQKIRNNSILTLDGCANIAGETSLAYDTIFTLTYVYGVAVGIGAYLARLGHRVIQKNNNSPMLLTGYRALNKLLGQEVYSDNDQLGDYNIMANNGISQLVVSDDMEGADIIKLWLLYLTSNPIPKILNKYLISADCLLGLEKIVDGGLLLETMPSWARSLITGRCKINDKSFSVIGSRETMSETIIPADIEDRSTSKIVLNRGAHVLYPESSYKMAQTIRDSNREGLPLILWMNWRGFSGGSRDMFNEVLKYGSMIVDELRLYKHPIYAYLAPNSQLRGGAMVVMSSSINPHIRMWADSSAKIGILEPEGAFEIKFKKHLDPSIKKSDIINLINLYDSPENSSIMKIVELENFRDEIVLDISDWN
jgi:biotin carboxylase